VQIDQFKLEIDDLQTAKSQLERQLQVYKFSWAVRLCVKWVNFIKKLIKKKQR
jgi:hypothetical protein